LTPKNVPGLFGCDSFPNFPFMNLEKLRPDKYLKYLYLPNLFAKRTKQILSVNPTVIPHREEAKEISIFVFDYNAFETGRIATDNINLQGGDIIIVPERGLFE